MATREKWDRGLVFLNTALFPPCSRYKKEWGWGIEKDGAGAFVETERTPEIKDAFEMVSSFYPAHPGEQGKACVCAGYY